jgi:hypothetical protein
MLRYVFTFRCSSLPAVIGHFQQSLLSGIYIVFIVFSDSFIVAAYATGF